MLTILLTHETEHPEWKLFHPFFYHLEANDSLFYLPYNDAYEFEDVCPRIYHELAERQEDTWQLILLLHNDAPVSLRNRLVNRLAKMKEKILEPLKEREAEPRQVTVLLLDSAHQENGYQAGETKVSLQLDKSGFLYDASMVDEACNLWVYDDFKRLDNAWGEAVDILEAGLLENPKDAFLELLEVKASAVRSEFLACCEEKHTSKEMMRGDGRFIDPYSWREEQQIVQNFLDRLKKTISPPVHSDIRNFQPSTLLKNVLRETLTLDAVIGPVNVIRQEVSAFSRKRKFEQWLEAVALINSIIEAPEILSNFPKGAVYGLETKLDEITKKHMFQNYEASLEGAVYFLENQLLKREAMITTKYEETKAHPYAAGDLAGGDIEAPVFEEKTRQFFLQKWRSFIEKGKEQLAKREYAMKEEAKQGIRKLKTIKRSSVDEEKEQVEIYDYVQRLKEREEELAMEMEVHTPPPLKEQDMWAAFCRKIEFQLANQLEAFPSRKMMFLTGIFVWVGFSYPVYWTMGMDGLMDWRQWLFPLTAGLAVTGIGWIALARIKQPIHDYVSDTVKKRTMLEHQQSDAHSEMNHYLNAFFELDRVQKKLVEVEEVLRKEQMVNHLYRYHLHKAKEALDAYHHMNDYFRVEKPAEENKEIVSFVDRKYNPSEDVIRNPMYSPVICGQIGLSGQQATEILMGQTRKSVVTGKLPLLQQIKLEKDQVYLS